MTLRDFLKRVTEEDMDKMLLWFDGWCWSNIQIDSDECSIYIKPCEVNSPFSSDK